MAVCRDLPKYEPRLVQNKKKVSRDILAIMDRGGEGSGDRLEDVRRFAAIYGRFDAKRKPHKPLTLHEVYASFRFVCFFSLFC